MDKACDQRFDCKDKSDEDESYCKSMWLNETIYSIYHFDQKKGSAQSNSLHVIMGTVSLATTDVMVMMTVRMAVMKIEIVA